MNKTEERWWDDEEFSDSFSERFSISSPVGKTCSELVKWAQEIEKEYGTGSVIDDLDLDEDHASIAIAKGIS